jgi:hypothetical protein
LKVLSADFYERNCTGCHEGGRMFSGFPDLNFSVALNSPPLFKAIVLDGARAGGRHDLVPELDAGGGRGSDPRLPHGAGE